jgi:hypothetical protein
MGRRMQRLIGMRLAEPAYSLVEELAIADTRTVASMARRLLLERLSQIIAERQQLGSPITQATADTGAAAAEKPDGPHCRRRST